MICTDSVVYISPSLIFITQMHNFALYTLNVICHSSAESKRLFAILVLSSVLIIIDALRISVSSANFRIQFLYHYLSRWCKSKTESVLIRILVEHHWERLTTMTRNYQYRPIAFFPEATLLSAVILYHWYHWFPASRWCRTLSKAVAKLKKTTSMLFPESMWLVAIQEWKKIS